MYVFVSSRPHDIISGCKTRWSDVIKLTVTVSSPNNVRSLMPSQTVMLRSASRGQTFKNSSKDLMFVVFPSTSSLVPSWIIQHLRLLPSLKVSAKHCLRSNALFSQPNQQQIHLMCRRIYQTGARARKRSSLVI